MHQNIHTRPSNIPEGQEHTRTNRHTHAPTYLNRELALSLFSFLICVDSKSVLCALQNWDCKMRRDIVYEVKYLIHCAMLRGIGIEFCWVPSHVLFTGIKYQINQLNKGQWKTCLKYHTTHYFHLMRFLPYLNRMCSKTMKKIHLRCFLVQGS